MKQKLTQVLVCFTLLALTFGAIGVTPAHATTLTVLNTNDTGVGSLRQTIADAGVGDTIDFAAGLSGQTIFLASTLTLAQNVTIDGSALTSPITISGDTNDDDNTTPNVRVLLVNIGVTAILDSLIITEGAIGDDGGGIANVGMLTITNSTLSSNIAGSEGGGIYNFFGTVTITDSTFSDNTAGSGGGIYNNNGTVIITDSMLSGNSATVDGGGISGGGTLTITDSTLDDNTASSTGGAIYQASGNATITGSTLSGNNASASGGGVYSNSGNLTVTNSTLYDNHANLGSGGGIYNFGSTLNVTGSTFDSNGASGSGGGIYNYLSNTLNVTNSTFSANGALYGGGLINYGALMITNSTLSGNIATNQGGGIYNDSAPLNYANTIIANNTGGVGGVDCYNLNTIGTNTNNLVETITDTNCSATFNGDPNLDSLADNGGSTWTFALLTGSSAIDAGDDTTCTNPPVSGLDQRSITRSHGAHCDIGSYEYIPPATATPTVTSTPTITATRTATRTATSTNTITATPTKTVTKTSTATRTITPTATQNLTPVTVTINQAVGQTDPTNTQLLSFTAVFSEAVSGFTSADVNVNLSVACAPTVTVTGSGTTYNVALTDMTKECTATVSIPAGVVNSVSRPTAVNAASTSTDNSQEFEYLHKSYYSIGANDGWVLETTAGSNMGGSMNSTNTTMGVGDDASNREYRIISRFDTSTNPIPPDAVIPAINYRIKQSSIGGTNPLGTHGNLITELNQPYFGTSGNLELVDFQSVADKSVCNFETTLLPGNAYRCVFFKVAIAVFPKSGVLDFRSRFALADTNNVADLLNIYSGNSATISDRPQLFVSYYFLP